MPPAMLNCEQCGASFPEPTSPVEVVSTKVLCPKCVAERKAARAAAAAKAGAPAARPASAGAAPAARTASAPAAARPAPAAAAKPAPAVAASNGAPRATSRAGAKPAPALRGKSPTKADMDEIHREARALKAKEEAIFKYAWIIAGIVLVGAGGAYMYVRGVQTTREKQLTDYLEANKNYEKKLSEFDLTKKAGALELQKFIQEAEASGIAKREEVHGTTLSYKARAKSLIDSFEAKEEYTKRLVKLEEDMRSPRSLTSERLAELRRDYAGLVSGLAQDNVDARTRLAVVRKSIDEVYPDKLHEELKALPSTGSAARQTLVRYGIVEDEIRQLFEEAFKSDKKAVEGPLGQHYKAIIQESDAIAERTFTAAEINATPWMDLLSGDQKAKWVPATQVGFEWGIDDRGTLTAKGPSKDAKGYPVLSIGDHEKWRDYQLEMEIEIKRGAMDVYLRAPKSLVGNVQYESFGLDGAGGFSPGVTYPVTITLIGSKRTLEVREASFEPVQTDVKWLDSRLGAVALVFRDQCDIKIKKMRIRAMR